MLEARHFTIFTDHKPITYAFQKTRVKCSPRQFNHLDFVAQFTTDIKHISGQDNVVSRRVRHCATIIRRTGPSTGRRRRAPNTPGVNHRPTARETTDPRHHGLHLLRHVCWEISTVRSRSPTAPSVPVRPRSVAPGHQNNGKAGREAFRVARRAGLPHPGTCLPILPAVQSLPPYSNSIGRLYSTGSPLSARPHRPGWSPSDVSRLHNCLTAVDRFTHWPEVIPVPDITADTVARALLTGWISHFGCPQTITTDQGRHFESHLFQSLARMCGIELALRTAHHPTANGLVDRFHRTLNAAIMCQADQQWAEALPLVLLGIRTAYKEDLQASVAELVYGEPLRIPGELLTPTAEPVDPAHLITELRQHMARLRPVPAARHTSRLHSYIAISRGAPTSSSARTQHAGLWNTRTAAPTGPSRRVKTLQLLVRGRPVTVNGQGQAGLHPQRDRPREQLQPASRNINGRSTISHATTAIHKNYTLRPSHLFPCSLKHLSRHLREGVMYEPLTMHNRQLPPCSKSRRHLYPTDYWKPAQALTNQRQQLKLRVVTG
jgi:hypothetical protein